MKIPFWTDRYNSIASTIDNKTDYANNLVKQLKDVYCEKDAKNLFAILLPITCKFYPKYYKYSDDIIGVAWGAMMRTVETYKGSGSSRESYKWWLLNHLQVWVNQQRVIILNHNQVQIGTEVDMCEFDNNIGEIYVAQTERIETVLPAEVEALWEDKDQLRGFYSETWNRVPQAVRDYYRDDITKLTPYFKRKARLSLLDNS